jgi:uncharacterized protein
MKFLVVALVVVLGLWLLLRGRKASGDERRAPPAPSKPGAVKGPEAMVSCARCGVHLPQGDALFDPAGRPFCGAEHRDARPG